MKKAKNILFIVSIVLSFVMVACYLILTLSFLLMSSPEAKEAIIKGLNDGTITTTMSGSPEEIAEMIVSLYRGFAIAFGVFTALNLSNGIISIVSKNKENKALYIVNIVLGILSMVIVNTVAGIFGLVILNKNENKQVIDVQ